jgi:hypothetical protein
LHEAAEKKARKKAGAEAVHQAQEAHKSKIEEALVGWPKRCSKRLQSRIRNMSQ